MEKKKDKNFEDPYVVVATTFGHANQVISAPMEKASAEALADKITDSMKDIDAEFQVFKNVKVKKFTPEPSYISKDKKDPYGYSVLDSLDAIIKN